jgi:ribonuclease HII
VNSAPTWEHEVALWQEGYSALAGVDEAGRGAWAGPLVAAAVIIPPGIAREARPWTAVRDSKLLTPLAREQLYPLILEQATVGIGVVSSTLLDLIGLGPANRLAMVRAIRALASSPDHLLIDAFKLRSLKLPQRSIIRGDQISPAIAAASVVAKVYRDRLMCAYEVSYPGYGFAAHKGYGTAAHQAALGAHGPTPLHRRCFAPIAALVGRVQPAPMEVEVDGYAEAHP